jgi:uncharacterized protein YbcI
MALRRSDLADLKELHRCRNITRRKKELLARGGARIHRVLREIAINILRGNVKLSERQRKNLRKYKRNVRALALKKTPVKTRVRMLSQKGGFIGHLLAPVLGMLASSILS